MSSLVSNIVQVHPFRRRENVLEHLLLLRSPDRVHCPNVWQVVTGTIEPGERPAQTALRELFEETGLTSSDWYALPNPALFYFQPTDQIVVSPVFACEFNAQSVPVISAEHVDYVWLDTTESLARLAFASQREAVRTIQELLRVPDGLRHHRL